MEIGDGKYSLKKGEAAATALQSGLKTKNPRGGRAEGSAKAVHSQKSQKKALSIAEQLSVFTGASTIVVQKNAGVQQDLK